ncbi:MAG TPA: hypothetical protein VK597_00590 [Inquilinus sp.]|nr:hypothetical protein [Inquilinus sp.]
MVPAESRARPPEPASISLIMFAILLVFTLIDLRMAMRGERDA